jgi:hypothetical protein
MSAPRKWKNRSRSTQLRLPIDYLTIAKRWLELVDAGDEEAMDLINRRFLNEK